MSIVSYALKGNLKRFDDNLKKISKESGIGIWSLRFKFLNSFRMLGCGYSDFLNYELYKKTKSEILEYVSIKDQDKFYGIVSPSKYKNEFSYKPNFLKGFKKYIDRDFFVDEGLDELEKFLDKHEKFMVKPYDGLGGHKVDAMFARDVEDTQEFYEKLKNERLFLEEYVVQHEKINEICPSCVNTIRIMTFGYNGKSEIMFAGMRFGNGEASVDNFHQGGMAVLVDVETGKLVGSAFNKNLDYFDKHPKSGVKFDGFQIPNWDKIKKMVLEAALVSEHIHAVGWDVAVTEDGATFIEGNRRAGYDLPQVLSKRGRKDIMRHCLDVINENEGTNYKI
ncbi:MAG TPA: hypothetical protein DCY94_05325 [Firmicutes bacterium]|nr:hypothetical protein [Bacillota bacterium]